ncbi:hypothetical protein [Aquibium microcysteis]|uniref:hypothetical protein n=1 Tax=Aquibium microcysteis TaxID=675281 RepID=UPI00165D23F4|nr:hypothetical protein [Aquibium microcysteis]
MSSIIAIIRALMGIAPTTDSALKGITKALKDLDKVQAIQTKRIGKTRVAHSKAEIRHRRAVDRLTARETAAHEENVRAQRVASKIAELVS